MENKGKKQSIETDPWMVQALACTGKKFETISIFQKIKEKLEKKNSKKMVEFCQIIERHQKKNQL